MLMWKKKEKRREKTGSPSRQFVFVHLTLFSLYINKLLHCPFSSNNNKNNLVSAIRVGTFSLTDTRRAIFNIVNCLSWNNFSMVKGKKKKTKKKFIHVLCNVARFPAAPSASSYLRVSSLVSWETRTQQLLSFSSSSSFGDINIKTSIFFFPQRGRRLGRRPYRTTTRG